MDSTVHQVLERVSREWMDGSSYWEVLPGYIASSLELGK